MNTVNIKLYDIFRNDLRLPETKAKELVEAIEEAVTDNITHAQHEYKSLWKDDFNTLDKDIRKLELKVEQTKSELSRAIFWAGLIQFLAIVASVVSIVGFMLRK